MTIASSYPTGLDSFTTGTLTGIVSGTDHGNKADAINKIEAELGVLPKGSYASVRARLDDGVFKSTDSRIDGKVAFNAAVSANAWVRIDSGTGSLTDNATGGPMGIKVKFDSTAAGVRGPIQANLNIVDGTASDPAQGILSRIDVNDSGGSSGGDTVAGWFDNIINTASGRATWGTNTYVWATTGSGYTAAGVGSEVGFRNDAAAVNPGGAEHYVSHGTTDVRFGNLFGGSSGVSRFEHSIMVSSTTPPTTNMLYFGPFGADNTPSGTALFKVTTTGAVFAGPLATFGQTLGASADAIAVQRAGVAFPRTVLTTDAKLWFGNGTATADVNLYREGANILATDDKLHVVGALELDGALDHDGTTVGFYGTTPVALQTGVAVTAAAIHAALVNVGLITA